MVTIDQITLILAGGGLLALLLAALVMVPAVGLIWASLDHTQTKINIGSLD